MKYIDRKNTDCNKWDALETMFGEENLLPLWVADMDFQVADCVQKALKAYVEQGVFGYMKVRDSYYDACIDWEFKHHGFKMEKEWIKFSPGVVAAINWLVQIFTEEGDAVIVNTPVYYPFMNAVKDNHRRLVTSELVNTEGSYTIDFADFEKKIIDNQVKLFILCSPHNPVGRVWTKEELKRAFDICRAHQVMVISDEIHQDLTYGTHEHTPSFMVGDYNDMLISLYAPSKTFNLAGCQNSEVIIPDEKLRNKWTQYVNEIRVLNGNAFGYIAAEAAYKGGAEWLDEVRAQILENYLYLKNTLEEALPKIKISELQGTYCLLYTSPSPRDS